MAECIKFYMTTGEHREVWFDENGYMYFTFPNERKEYYEKRIKEIESRMLKRVNQSNVHGVVINPPELIGRIVEIVTTGEIVHEHSRPSWDEYFLMIAQTVSLRSDDKFIKHGAVIVDNSSRYIIGTGYNNTIPGADLNIVKPYDRDYRRDYMQHAEKNAILNCSSNPRNLKDGATIYVTGLPCYQCLQDIISFGITRIVHLERAGGIENEKTKEIRNNLLKMSGIKVNVVALKPWTELLENNFKK